MERSQPYNEVVITLFKAVALATGAAAIVLGTFGAASAVTLPALLSIGPFCLAVASGKR